MSAQITSTIMMVKPAHFGFNQETASNNAFQTNEGALSASAIESMARKEFEQMVDGLSREGVQVWVVEDSPEPVKPDAVFPNNWISFHSDGTIVTYPMFARQRRLERRVEIVEQLKNAFGFDTVFPLEKYEEQDRFLEGTGSMILDRIHEIAYTCRSIRTDEQLLDQFCEKLGYRKMVFNSVDKTGMPIYHTNVMMALGVDFAIIALESIPDEKERRQVVQQLEESGKEIIPITMDQVYRFAGNMLQVKTAFGDPLLVMSEQAFKALEVEQVKQLQQKTKLFHCPIPVIEQYGGGSVRCMMAEVFLPENKK